MKNTILIIFFLISTHSLFAQMQTMVDTKKTYEGITVIEIEAGMLDVHYGGQANLQEVQLEAFLESDSDLGQDIVFVTIGNTLKVQYQTPQRTRNHRSKGHIRVEGPAEMKLAVRTTSGKVNLENLKSHETHLDFVSGNIQLRNIEGDVYLKGTSGNISAQNIEGDVIAKLTSGSAKLDGIGRNLEFVATSGRLEAKNIEGLVDVKLTSGDIRMENIGEIGNLSVTSGNINATNSNLGNRTSLNGSSGNIRVQTNSDLNLFNYDFSAGSGNIEVGKTSSARNLAINNDSQHTITGKMGSGNITIEN